MNGQCELISKMLCQGKESRHRKSTYVYMKLKNRPIVYSEIKTVVTPEIDRQRPEGIVWGKVRTLF